MRVTHVITRLIVGGAQENTIASVLGLNQIPGCQANLLSGPSVGPEGSLESTFDNAPGLLVRVPSLVRPLHPVKDLLAARALTRFLVNTQPDLVHTHSGKAGVLGRLAAANAKIPVVVHTIHGPSFGPFQGVVPNLLYRTAERYAAVATTQFVSVADAMSRQYLQAGIGRPDQYVTIRSGFDLKPFLSVERTPDTRKRLGIEADAIVVGKIARLFQLKGHDALFSIAPALVQACPKMRFLLVGGGEWRERFQGLVRGLGLERFFIFTGLVQPSAIPSCLAAMDVLVHLSEREGLARALPQALAAGVPVVAFDRDGANEVCLDGRTGLLVPPGDLELLRTRLLQLAADPAQRSRLGAAGRQLVRQQFSVTTMVEQLYELYNRLLAHRSGRLPAARQ